MNKNDFPSLAREWLDDIKKRFWARVDKKGPNDCWLWTGHLQRGYGSMCVRGPSMRVHRISLELHGISIPEGMLVDHLCRVRNCVNPKHLRIVTPRVNTIENSLGGAARNAAKTHCAKGHPYDEENTHITKYRTGRSQRVCRICMKNKSKNRRVNAL